MENRSIEKEIISLEKLYWKAMKENDLETMLMLSDEHCILAGPQGVSKVAKKDFKKMMESSPYTINNFTFDDNCEVSVLNNDTAVIAYKISEDLTVDGKPLKLDASESSTWIKRNGKWVCSLHTEALLSDPFGRDREKKVPK